MSIRKAVVIGPESTGKSTLSEALAKALNTVWVPEYAREYLHGLGRPYTQDDLLEIAKRQVNTEDQLAQHTNDILICDTDLYVIKVWSEAKYGNCDPWILEQLASRQYDLYILTDIDFEWQDDPLREHPMPYERQYFYDIYKDIVQNSGLPFIIASGTHEQRLGTALEAIRTLAQ